MSSVGFLISKTLSLVLTAVKYKPFISLTVDELVFGYDDTLVKLAHKFYPRNKRPMEKMGLLIAVIYRKWNFHQFPLIPKGYDQFIYFIFLAA